MRLLLLLCLVTAVPALAQEAPDAVTAALMLRADTPVGAPALTGDLRTDALGIEGAHDGAGTEPAGFFGQEGHRNPALALGLSAAVPGLGQAYNGSWVRAAVAAGLEVGLWAGFATWRKGGLDGEDAYQDYAHRDWSPARFATWLNGYPGYSGDDIDVSAVEGIDFTNPDAWSSDEQGRVRVLVDAIRTAERETSYNNADGTGSGNGFSHVLPYFAEQQYYELIGKYYQYGPGWSDWCEGADCNDAAYYTLEQQTQRDVFIRKTALFFDYAADHAEANTLLRRSSRVLSVVLANHAFSAFDAFLTARLHNRRLSVDTGLLLRPDGRGGTAPVANLRLRF